MSKRLPLALAILVFVAAPALANPTTYTILDATFTTNTGQGFSVTGSFTLDPDAGAPPFTPFADITVVSARSILSGTYDNVINASPDGPQFQDAAGDILQFGLNGSLSDSGIVDLQTNTGYAATLLHASAANGGSYDAATSAFGYTTTNDPTTSAQLDASPYSVAEPASIALLLAAAAGAVGARRRAATSAKEACPA